MIFHKHEEIWLVECSKIEYWFFFIVDTNKRIWPISAEVMRDQKKTKPKKKKKKKKKNKKKNNKQTKNICPFIILQGYPIYKAGKRRKYVDFTNKRLLCCHYYQLSREKGLSEKS